MKSNTPMEQGNTLDPESNALNPAGPHEKTWGSFAIFNIWANDVQSLFGYTLVASLFISYGVGGWTAFAGLIAAGLFVMWMVNLSGAPGEKYGIPYPVLARASLGTEAVAKSNEPNEASRRSVRISARTGDGLDALRRILLEVAGWQSAPEGIYIARARHVQALAQVQGHLEQASAQLLIASPALDLLAEELRLAQNALGAITGEFSSDDLLGVIFSSFCIGK